LTEVKTIAIVANTTWNIYNFRLNVIEKLLTEGFKVIVMSPVDEYIHYKKQFPDVTHVPIKRLHRDSTNPIKDIRLTLELTRLYKKHKPDLVIHYPVQPNIYGAIAARMNHISSIGIVTGLGFAFLHKGYIKRITKLLYRSTSKFHDKVIFENKDDRELFIKEHLIKEAQGISIKGCGVNAQFFSPMPNGLYPEKVIFTFIGRLLYDKGVQEFVDAAELVKSKNQQAEFWLVGDIDDQNPASVKKDDLVKWVKNNSVIYHGSTRDVREYIAHSDCIVLPSYREAIARSITEGMAMQRPVITTDVAGCREAVDEGINGFLVPVKNAAALAEAMERFIHLDESEREHMGLQGREKVLSEFDDRIIAEDIFKIVSEVLGK